MHRPPFRALNYRFAPAGPACIRLWQFLYFFPLPHGHGSLRPTLSRVLRIGSAFLSLAALVVAFESASLAGALRACWESDIACACEATAPANQAFIASCIASSGAS